MVSVEQEAELQRESQDIEPELPGWWELINMVISHLAFAVMLVDFEGRSAELGFVLDSIDMGLNFCCMVVVVTRIVLEIKLRERLTKVAIADVVIALIYLSGMAY